MTVVTRANKQNEYTFLSLIVTNFDVRTGAAISPEIRTGRACSPDTKIVEHHTALDIECLNIDPDEPLSDSYSFTIYGNSDTQPRLEETLADYHVEDKEGFKKYRKRRGVEMPVYDIPSGLAVLSKMRGERRWSTALWLTRDVVSDMLVLLNGEKQVYTAAHLKHESRKQ